MGHSPCYTHSSRKALPGLPTVHTLQASLAARIANTPAAPGQHGTLQKCNTPTASDRHLSFHPPLAAPPTPQFLLHQSAVRRSRFGPSLGGPKSAEEEEDTEVHVEKFLVEYIITRRNPLSVVAAILQ